MNERQNPTTRLPDPADYSTYGAWFRALEHADQLIKDEAWGAHEAAQTTKEKNGGR